MIAAVVLGLLLAQAEPAPPNPPVPPTAPATAAAPAAADPAAVPPPASLLGAASPDGDNTISVFVGASYRVPTGNALAPAAGFSVGGVFERSYWRLGPPEKPSLYLAANLGFFHDHFTVTLEQPYSDNRLITQTGFSIAQIAAIPFSWVTLWASVGAGLTLGYFSSPSPTLKTETTSSRQPFVCGSAGLDWAIKPGVGIRIRVNFTHTLTRPDFVDDTGNHLDLFGDLFDSGIGLFYRF